MPAANVRIAVRRFRASGTHRGNELRLKRLTLCVIATVLVCGCAKPKPQPIIVGSKESPAQMVVAEVIAQHLEKKLGQPVERHLNLGTARYAHEALISSQID